MPTESEERWYQREDEDRASGAISILLGEHYEVDQARNPASQPSAMGISSFRGLDVNAIQS